MDLLRTSSSKNPINTSSNVLLLYRMNELQHLGRVNFGLAVGTLLYLATNVVLFTFNAMDRNDDACGDPEGNQVRAVRVARVTAPVPHLRVLGGVPLRLHRGDVVDFHAASPCYGEQVS